MPNANKQSPTCRMLLTVSLLAAGYCVVAPPAVSAPARQAPGPQTKSAFVRQSDMANRYLNEAWAMFDKNQIREGFNCADLVVKKEPNCGRAYILRGYALFKLEKPDQAVSDIKHGIELLPDKRENFQVVHDLGAVWTYHNLVAALQDLGKNQEAIDCLDKAPESVKDCSILSEDRAGLYSQLKQYDRSVTCYSQAIKVQPSNQYLYRQRVKAYLSLKKPNQALADLNVAIEKDPQESSLYSYRAEAYKLLSRTDLAKKDYSKANELGSLDFPTP